MAPVNFATFQVLIYGLVLVVVLTKFCADPKEPRNIFGENGWLQTARRNQQRVPEPNPEVEEVREEMDRWHTELENFQHPELRTLRTELENLQSAVSKLQRRLPVRISGEALDINLASP